ncbi:hypothetical protein F5877DRAFT_78945 [Lentinula edodes]|nr:hypothetical protein F5877DRAFT_78945 [Lentinula edodes]
MGVGVSAVSKEVQKAEIRVAAANTQLKEQLDRAEQDIQEIRKLSSPSSTPTLPPPHPPHPAASRTQPKAHNMVASPSQRKISLVWISSEDEADCPDDSEDSDDSRSGWIPQSATKVTSDEDEPLPGLGGVTAAEARVQRAGKSIEKTYLVYHGRNNSEGLYFEWQGTKGATGVLELTDEFPDAVYKLFNNRKLAAKAYKECKCTGVLDIFKSPVQAKEHLIVVKGENPGVYNRRMLMKHGLCWHGGKVIVHIGTHYDAQQAFLALKNNHQTYKLPKEKHWGLS